MSEDFKYKRLDKNNAAVLLLDHQMGLINLVKDFSPDDFRNSVLAVADAAKYFKLPVVLTASFEDGPILSNHLPAIAARSAAMRRPPGRQRKRPDHACREGRGFLLVPFSTRQSRICYFKCLYFMNKFISKELRRAHL